MTAFLDLFVHEFAGAMAVVDKGSPAAGKGGAYGAGIGPHTETSTIRMVMARLASDGLYIDRQLEVHYGSGERCDLCLGKTPRWDWAIEAKLLRAKLANGSPDDQNIGHILSPYPNAGSAVADSEKLVRFATADRKAILIIGYDYDDWPMEVAVEAFEVLARARVSLGERQFAPVTGLIHPVHQRGGVFAWEVLAQA